ncbi:MAG: hypothetical protein RAO92_06590 [Candidatus Euphemobacter frigidus]|nr:hypothetical protein [Candidatus Euphemobacter frigidus]MDP8276054.1 hypothetical protein [Candidatus Euphemobacter frigidus]
MKEEEPLWIVQDIPGRMRLKFRAEIRRIPDLDAILGIDGVEEVTFNKITKSLLIIYDKAVLDSKELMPRIKRIIPRVKLQPGETSGSDMEGNLLSQFIYGTATGVNRRKNRATRGYADFTSIVRTLLIAWAIEELIRNPVMPKWYDIARAVQAMFAQFSTGYEQKIGKA